MSPSEPTAQIAETFNVTRATIYRHLAENHHE